MNKKFGFSYNAQSGSYKFVDLITNKSYLVYKTANDLFFYCKNKKDILLSAEQTKVLINFINK